jgi:hypothetical protein
MRISRSYYLAFLVLFTPAIRAENPEKIIQDTWDAAYVENAKSGYQHTSIREIDQDGNKRIRATVELKLNLRRNGRVVATRTETGDEETVDGKILAVFMRQFQGDQEYMSMRGEVINREMLVKVSGKSGALERRFRWDDRVVGIYYQEQMFKTLKVKPGDHFTYVTFEPTIDNVLVHRVTVRDYETIKVQGKEKRYLRVDSTPDKLNVAEGSLQLPSLSSWLGEDLMPAVSKSELPALGNLVLIRSKASDAKNFGAGPDILDRSLILVNKTIQSPNRVQSGVFRITVRDEQNPGGILAEDDRQKRTSVDGNTFELRVQAKREPEPVHDSQKIGDEYLSSCHFIDSDNPQIKALARQAVNGETDPWRKARRIERWVHNNMHVGFSENFAPASTVARSRQGDCRQHALLAAAMCRAAGIPSKTAIGLVYEIDQAKGPAMAFHMWTEVWVQGQWLAIDATRGEGSIGAMHIKITDSSWANTQSLSPLLPVLRVLGRLSIEIVSIDGAE